MIDCNNRRKNGLSKRMLMNVNECKSIVNTARAKNNHLQTESETRLFAYKLKVRAAK